MQTCVLESICACVRREAKVLLHTGQSGGVPQFPKLTEGVAKEECAFLLGTIELFHYKACFAFAF